ncbi:MAG TPA: FHA domain-containing protein, partial [Lentisphaeria bacterium]|nr:FHA domain-containing protein [Lentisphaeria bacterium]
HAGDINIGQFLEGIRGMSSRELIDYVAKCPPQWQRVDLWKIGSFGPPRGLPPAPAEARTARLTLRFGQRRLHLLSAETAKLGRNRDNDIVLRCFDAAGAPLRQPSLQISGCHATISREHSGAVSFRDRSANGTMQNGIFLNQAEVGMQPDHDYRLGVGADVEARKAVLELTARVFRCCVPLPDHRFCPPGFCSRREACGLLLQRMDEVSEDYALVWCHLELSSCRPGWPSLSVWRFPEGFAWRMEEKSGWLYPDACIALPGGACHVEAFTQIGL